MSCRLQLFLAVVLLAVVPQAIYNLVGAGPKGGEDTCKQIKTNLNVRAFHLDKLIPWATSAAGTGTRAMGPLLEPTGREVKLKS